MARRRDRSADISLVETSHFQPPPTNGSPRNGERRRRIICFGVCLLWAAIVARLLQVQWWKRDEFTRRAEKQHLYEETVPARAGDILDRNGRLLATTVPAWSVYADPVEIAGCGDSAGQELVSLLAETLSLDSQKLSENLRASSSRRFVWIKRRLSQAEFTALRELRIPRALCGYVREFERHYPQGDLAAHVLGLRDIDGHGRGGIEESCDDALSGSPGKRMLIRDARGYVINIIEEQSQPARNGQDIVLTVDSVLQSKLEQRLDSLLVEFAPQSVCGIIMQPATGEVLAMATRPAFNPEHPANVPAENWKNQAVAAMFEPGSTFKPMIVAWALDKHLIQTDEEFFCENGAYRMGKRVLHDHHHYGRLSLSDILVKSSNIGMAKIGERMTNVELFQAATAFGFGRKTGIELPGELSGTLRPLDKWDSFSTGSIPMGQEVSATPLQILAAHAALANGGCWKTPHLLLKGRPSLSRDAARASQEAVDVVSAETAHWLVQGPLTAVVDHGTGTKAKRPNIHVFGKTGTAQKIDPETKEYSHSRYVSSFVCGAPAEHPEALLLISVDEPTQGASQFGGAVAAPAAGDMLAITLKHLGIESATEQAAQSETKGRARR